MTEAAQLAAPGRPAGRERKAGAGLLCAVMAAILAAVIIAMVFVGGQRRGMDHVIEEAGLQNDPTAIAIALSDLVYHLDAGYVAYATVLNKLEEVWTRGVKHFADEVQIRNNADAALLNEGLGAAAGLGPQKPAYVSDGTLVTMIYSDVGYVDFAKLAFRLFGIKIQSLYYTFFLLLALSTVAYLITFGLEPIACSALLCALFCFFIELHTDIFTPDVPTFHGVRHSSTLALVPALHFGFLLLDRRRPSAAVVLATLLQLAILLSTIRTRVATNWVPVFVVAVALTLAVLAHRRRPPEQRTLWGLVKDAARWPAVLLLGGLFAFNAYAKTTLHPVYFTDDVMPYHGYWHVAYISLLYISPQVIPPNSAALAFRKYGYDFATYAAAGEYLVDSHFMPPSPNPESVPAAFMSPWTGNIKTRLHDDIMQRVVLKIVARHPFEVLATFIVKKPVMIAKMIRRFVWDGTNRNSLWFVLLGGLAASGFLGLTGAGAGTARVNAALALLVGLLLFSALPNLLALPGVGIVSDAVLATFLCLQIAVCALALAGARLAAKVVRRRRPPASPATATPAGSPP